MRSIVPSVFALSVAAFLLTVPGVAGADDPLQGMTYKDASAALAKDKNAKVVVSSVSGDRLARDECLVAHWKKAVMKDGTGKYVGVQYQLDLNCNGPLAAAGTPGNSLNSEVGKAEKQRLDTIDALNANPEYCNTSAQIHANCVTLCEKYKGKCTFQLTS
ncbi:hypothetical protein [Mycolicibacterium sp. NCC-Tsukiji]|uniref:hypothetical protein n=1 Tax=Mycolicibacterium sp. NCC-Tsukiji TaxID=2185272 RepID=UPI00107F8BE9|nr:hypothetical protein [Mycolicibacterium sp. NCC-Tsukiji]